MATKKTKAPATTTTLSQPEAVPEAPAAVDVHTAPSTITKRVPREHAEPNPRAAGLLSPQERKLGGVYRLIHGTLVVPLPPASYTLPSGEVDPRKPTYEVAHPGDEVQLNDVDAAHCLDAGVVEPLDTKPSRLGKVWQPPKVIQQFSGMPTQVPDGASASRI